MIPAEARQKKRVPTLCWGATSAGEQRRRKREDRKSDNSEQQEDADRGSLSKPDEDDKAKRIAGGSKIQGKGWKLRDRRRVAAEVQSAAAAVGSLQLGWGE